MSADSAFGDPNLDAMIWDDQSVDFDRLDECIEWLCGDLDECGVMSGQRVGLCIRGGAEFVLAFHALLRMETVVVPLDPLGDDKLAEANDLDLHYVVSHRVEDDLIEDAITQVAGGSECPIFSVAEDFTVAAIGSGPLSEEAGVVVDDPGRAFWDQQQLTERIEEVRSQYGLSSRMRVMLFGNCYSAEAISLILASQLAGCCLYPDPTFLDLEMDAAERHEAAILFAPAAVARTLIEITPMNVLRRLCLVVEKPDVLPEIMIRQCGTVRESAAGSAIYDFTALVDQRREYRSEYHRTRLLSVS